MEYEKKPLILKAKVMDMLDYMSDRIRNFPRSEWRGITPRIQEAGFEMLSIASDIGNGFYTLTTLGSFDRQKNHMEAYLEYAHHRKYLTDHQYITWGAKITELGKINGGLTNALKANLNAQNHRRK